MTEAALPKDNNKALMSTGFIIGLVLIGLFSFSALIGLSGYADDIRDKNNGQAHALSNSAIGFAGLKILLENLNAGVTLDPNEASYSNDYELRIYTLNSAYQTDIFDELNADAPKLIVLPKWNVQPTPKAPGWVRKSPYSELQGAETLASNLEAITGEIELLQADGEDETLAKDYSFTIGETGAVYTSRFPRLQTLKGESLLPLVTTNNEGIILTKIKESQTYILSDPDFLNTAGLKTKSGARFAFDMLDHIQRETDTYGYVLDLALHGIGGRQNMVKLFTQPPFLAITVLLLTLLGLMGWQGFLRFGDPKKGHAEDFGEDLAMGPQSLARTTADFLAIARREPAIMKDYAELIRRQARTTLSLSGRDLASQNAMLDRREKEKAITPTFAALHEDAETLTNRQDMMRVAKALQDWKKDIIA